MFCSVPVEWAIERVVAAHALTVAHHRPLRHRLVVHLHKREFTFAGGRESTSVSSKKVRDVNPRFEREFTSRIHSNIFYFVSEITSAVDGQTDVNSRQREKARTR